MPMPGQTTSRAASGKWREKKLDLRHAFFQKPAHRNIHSPDETHRLLGWEFLKRYSRGRSTSAPRSSTSGSRQEMRERGQNVIEIEHTLGEAYSRCPTQTNHAWALPLGTHLWRRSCGTTDRRDFIDDVRLGSETDYLLMKVLGIIPARGGSKGIPNKCIAPCAGPAPSLVLHRARCFEKQPFDTGHFVDRQQKNRIRRPPARTRRAFS